MIDSNYYMAAISAEISITAIGAEIIEHTESLSISVKTTAIAKLTNGRKITVGPEWETESGKIKLATFENEHGQSREQTAEFTSEEELMVATVLGETIRWNIDTHRGEKAVRDFLLGNRYLNATLSGKPFPGAASFRLAPKFVTMMDHRELSRFASYRALLQLKRNKDSNLEFVAGSEMSFSEAA